MCFPFLSKTPRVLIQWKQESAGLLHMQIHWPNQSSFSLNKLCAYIYGDFQKSSFVDIKKQSIYISFMY